MSKPIEHLNKLFNHVRSGDINSIKLFMATYGGDPNILSEEGLSLGTTVMRSKDMGTEEKKIAVLRTLHSLGVELSLPDMNMQTPLHLAAKDKMENIFSFLLDNIPGFDSLLVQQDVMLKTPLEYLVLPGTESVTTYHASQLTDSPAEFFSTTAAVVPPKVVQEYAERIVGILNADYSFVKEYIMPMMNKLGENLHARNLEGLRERIHEVSHQIPGLLQSPADILLAVELTRTQLDDAVNILKSAFSGNRFASIPGMTSLSFFRPNMYDENFLDNLAKRKKHLKDQYNTLTEVEYVPYLGKYQGPVNSTQLHYPMILDYQTVREYPRWNPLGEDEKKKLLSILMTHPGAVLPRNHIINTATGYFIRGHNLTIMRADEDHHAPIPDYTEAAETILPVSETVKQFYATNIPFYEEESLAVNLYLGNMRYRYNGYQNIALQPDKEPHLLRHQNADVDAFIVGLTPPPDNHYKKLIDSIKRFSLLGAGAEEQKGGAELSAIDQFINAIGRRKFTIPSKGTREEKFDQMARRIQDRRLHPLLWEIIHQQEIGKFDLNQIKRSVCLLISANDFNVPQPPTTTTTTTRTTPISQNYFNFIRTQLQIDVTDIASSTELEIAMQKQRIHPTTRRLLCDLNDILHDNNNLCIRDSFHDMEEISIVTMAAVRAITDAADTMAMIPGASAQDVMDVVRIAAIGTTDPDGTVDVKLPVAQLNTNLTPLQVIHGVFESFYFMGSLPVHRACYALLQVITDCIKKNKNTDCMIKAIEIAVYGDDPGLKLRTIDESIFPVYTAVARIHESDGTIAEQLDAAINARPAADTLPLVTNVVLDSILDIIKAVSRVYEDTYYVLKILAIIVSGTIGISEYMDILVSAVKEQKQARPNIFFIKILSIRQDFFAMYQKNYNHEKGFFMKATEWLAKFAGHDKTQIESIKTGIINIFGIGKKKAMTHEIFIGYNDQERQHNYTRLKMFLEKQVPPLSGLYEILLSIHEIAQKIDPKPDLCLASCAGRVKLMDSIIDSFRIRKDDKDVIQMINQTVQAAEPINAQVQVLLDTTKETAEASAQLQALKLHSKDPLQLAIEKKRADKKKKAAQVGGASDDNPTLNEEYKEEIKELFMLQTCLAYYQAELLGVEMIGDTCFEENYRVWSQREHDGNNADGPYGIHNHTPIDALQKHQISGEYLTIKSNAAFLSQGTVTKVEERYGKYTGDLKTDEIMAPPPVPQDVQNYLRKHGKHATQDNFPLDAKYADENPITFVHPSRFDVPLRVIERRIKKWETRFNILQRRLTDIFKSENDDNDAIITCVAILQLMREIVNDIGRYVNMYELEKRDLINRYIPNLLEKIPDQDEKPFWIDALPSNYRTNTDIEGRLANSLAIAEDLFTIYANIDWDKPGFQRAFRSDLPFYPTIDFTDVGPTIDFTDVGPNMELISVGDTLLGMWKEKWLFYMIDRFDGTERLRFYEIASNILSKWFDYAARFVVYNKVKGETKTLSTVFDNYLKPQMHITVGDITEYYEKYQPSINNIHIMLSEDYDSLVPDWEFNQTFQVLDNNMIMRMLMEIKFKWGETHPSEWSEWCEKILSFFIDHFNDGFFTHKSIEEILDDSFKKKLLNKCHAHEFRKHTLEFINQMIQGALLNTKKAVADIDNKFTFPNDIDYAGVLNALGLLPTQKEFVNKDHQIQKDIVKCIERIIQQQWCISLYRTIQQVMGDAKIIDPNQVPQLAEKLVFSVLKVEGEFKYPSDPEDYDVETVMEEVVSRFNDENNVIRDRVIPYYKKLGERMVKDLHSISSNYLRYKIHGMALDNIQKILDE